MQKARGVPKAHAEDTVEREVFDPAHPFVCGNVAAVNAERELPFDRAHPLAHPSACPNE